MDIEGAFAMITSNGIAQVIIVHKVRTLLTRVHILLKFAFQVFGRSSVQFSSFFASGDGNPEESARRANPKSSSSSSPIVVIGITIAVVLVMVLGIIGYLAYLRKRTITKRKGIVYAICSTSLKLMVSSFQAVLV